MAHRSSSTETALATNGTAITALAMTPEEATELAAAMSDNFAGGGISIFDLPSLKVPSGGATTWEVQTASGDTSTPTVEGVVVDFAPVRTYFDKPYDGKSEPPTCLSPDTKVGIGDPGGDCATCPFAQFGTRDGGAKRGQACSERKQVLLFTEHGKLPYFLNLPPTSLGAWKTFMVSLVNKGLSWRRALVSATLTKDKNADGIAYSQVTWSLVRPLTAEELAKVETFRKGLAGVVKSTVRVPENEEQTATAAAA